MPRYLLQTLVVTLALSTGFLAAKVLEGGKTKLPNLLVGRLVINELEIRDPTTGRLVGVFRGSSLTDRRAEPGLLGLAIGPDLNDPQQGRLLLNVNLGVPEVKLIGAGSDYGATAIYPGELRVDASPLLVGKGRLGIEIEANKRKEGPYVEVQDLDGFRAHLGADRSSSAASLILFDPQGHVMGSRP